MLMFPAMNAIDPIRQRHPSHDRTSSVTFSMRQCAGNGVSPRGSSLCHRSPQTPFLAISNRLLKFATGDGGWRI
jgi:hypothetical protein